MSTIKSALITGIGGSGGSYLAEYIVEHHPEVRVHGFARDFNNPAVFPWVEVHPLTR